MASIVSIQNSLSAGELSPSLYGRTDLQKWHAGTSTCRNFFANYRGGVASRAGLAYVGTCKQPGTSAPPRDIPFQFSLNQGYALEFGDNYMRIKSDGGYVTEATKTISGITKANPAVITSTAHGYSAGDWVFINGVGGMTNFNGLTWIVNTATTNTFTLKDMFGNIVNSTTFSAYTSGGIAARIYTVVAPYVATDLPYLKYTQAADTMTLCLVNTTANTEYAPYSLVRHGATNWVFTPVSFGSTLAAPMNVVAVPQSTNTATTWYGYVVTAVSSTTGEESIASIPTQIQNNDISLYAGTNVVSWNAVPGASSYNIYGSTPSYGENIPNGSIYGLVGSSLGTSFADTNVSADFAIVPPQAYDPFARGAITDIIPSAGGINYDQSTINYTVHTSTGTDFFGLPVVTNGSLSGFVITNQGSGYVTGDTITFTDSGGGVAKGKITFSANPTTSDSIRVNGLGFTWTAETNGKPGDKEINLQNTLALTLQSTANFLNSQTELSVSVATYTSDATSLYITYKLPGTVGNAFTLSTTSGTASGANLTGGGAVGSGAVAALTISPETGTYPATAAYYQERRVYASSINNPDTYWMSQPGLFANMDSSIPVTDADAITGTPWAQQVNGIQWLVPMPGGLVVLTGKGAWQVNGGNSAAITPSNQTAIPQAYNGCNGLVPPITINYDILYVQAKGTTVRDLAYNFFVNIYTGTDMTVLSNHLFNNFQIVQWAWAEEPNKLVWAIRNDGIMLSLTYLKEQEVFSWTRHDTNGLFVSVCSITEPPVDAVYCIVQRYVNGQWMYYSERMDDRIWPTIEDAYCVDAGLSYPQTFPSATLTPSAASGTVTFNASTSVFNSGNVGNVIRVGGGKFTVTQYNSGTQVVGTTQAPITEIIPNDPNYKPIPQVAGNWSISVPTSTVTGLNHLEGMAVTALADGSVVPQTTVTNGTINLPNPASQIVVGLPYTCQMQTLYIDHEGQGSTVQNKRKTINSVGLRVEASRGLQIGADQIDASTQQNYATVPWNNMIEIKERSNFVNAGLGVPLFTGDYFVNITSGWDVKGQVAVQQVYPLPANILSVISYWTLGDDR